MARRLTQEAAARLHDGVLKPAREREGVRFPVVEKGQENPQGLGTPSPASWRRCRSGKMLIDLTNMTFVDSSGLSVLVCAYRRLRERGGDLSLRRPSASTRRVFESTGLNKVLPIEER